MGDNFHVMSLKGEDYLYGLDKVLVTNSFLGFNEFPRLQLLLLSIMHVYHRCPECSSTGSALEAARKPRIWTSVGSSRRCWPLKPQTPGPMDQHVTDRTKNALL